VTQGATGDDVAIEVIGSEMVLPNDTAVPLALMLNELIGNAVKYAGRNLPANVRVRLEPRTPDVALIVEDDGPGFVPDPAVTKRASGLGLVRGLARQLGGTLAVEQVPGARCTVTFRPIAL
jgi:two-component sensor histidine kinase